MMSNLKERTLRLGEQAAVEEGAPRFLASGKSQRFSGLEYEPIVVRTSDKEDSLRLLSAAEGAVADVALLLDVVVSQWELLAAQAAQLDRLEAEVEALRSERVATDVTSKVHDALLEAGRSGVEIKGFDFAIETADSLQEEREQSLLKTHGGQGEGVNEGRASLDLGAVLDALKGAHLSGERSHKTIESVRSRLTNRVHVKRSAARKASGKLKVEYVGQRVVPGSRNE